MTIATQTTQQGIVMPTTSPRAERLDRLGTAGRLEAAEEGDLIAADVATGYAGYPDEVPTINGEFPWIAATLKGGAALGFRREVASMSRGEASRKPWMPSVLAADRASFESKARHLDLEFLDRDGEPMRPADWIEAKGDPDYVLLDTHQLGDFRISTTWVGIHIPDSVGWHRVIFGTQVVDLTTPTLARLASQPSAEEGPDDPYDILSIHDPHVGEVVFRASHLTIADAERGHRVIVSAAAAARLQDQ